jgi:hypothetical protein
MEWFLPIKAITQIILIAKNYFMESPVIGKL